MHGHSWPGTVARRRGKHDVNWVRQTRASGRRTAIEQPAESHSRTRPNIEASETSGMPCLLGGGHGGTSKTPL